MSFEQNLKDYNAAGDRVDAARFLLLATGPLLRPYFAWRHRRLVKVHKRLELAMRAELEPQLRRSAIYFAGAYTGRRHIPPFSEVFLSGGRRGRH